MDRKKKITSPSFFIGNFNDDIISFGSGQPDLPPPKEVYDILADYAGFRYGYIKGQENLRNALSKNYPNAHEDNFIITNGASEALDLTMRYLSRKGFTRIALPRPYYYSYPFVAEYAGMQIEYYELVNGKINTETFFNTVSNCHCILINSPSNPTGVVQDLDVLEKIETFAAEKGIWIISDEVYKDLIYGRSNYLIQGKRVITINSFSKTYAMCGFRVGYIYCPDEDLIFGITEIKNHTSMNTNILGQEMAFEATKVDREIITQQVKVWKERRDTIYEGMISLGLELQKPEGAFYVLPKISNSAEAVNELFYDYKLIAYDGGWFGAPGHVRFSYALDTQKILQGLERLKQFLSRRSA